MILSIGRQGLKRKNRAGYTFIELILTASIILVIVALSTPLFRKTYYSLRVNLQTKDLAATLNFARERAIMTRAQHAIKLNPEKNTYRMLIINSETDETKPVEGRWGRAFTIYSGIRVESSHEIIKFYPDGTSNGAAITLTDISGLKGRIDIDARTGEITVESEKER